MAHLPENDLKLIADYMIFAGARISPKKSNRKKTFKEDLGKIQRTFMPNSSVVSFAIKYSDDLSLCWDAEKGATRYIWQGTLDPKSHFTSNGKTIPEIVGNVIYKSPEPLFKSIPQKINFLGYKVNDQGLPSFIYKRGDYQFIESHKFSEGNIYWAYQITGLDKLSLKLPEIKGYKTSVTKGTMQQGLVTLSKSDLSNFTIILSKEK